jgi:signal transduction histidine kinase
MRVYLWAVWLVAIAVTVVHALKPDGFVVSSSSAAPVFETAVACCAALLAVLFLGRWKQRLLHLDLAISYALGLLALGKLVFTVIPLARGAEITNEYRTAALLCGAVAAVALAAASLVPDRLAPSRHDVAMEVVFTAGVFFVLVVIVLVSPELSGRFPALTGPPSTEVGGADHVTNVTVMQLMVALAFVVASLRFARRDRLTGDTFYGWLAVTAALWALARVNYAWTSGVHAGDLTVGDWLRFAGYAIAVVAASYELTAYWRGLAAAAVLEERRQMARELHDGLAQELAFIVGQARSLSRKHDDDPQAELVARAAERALDESRRGIAALTRPVDEPLDVALAQQAEELSSRLGVRVVLDLAPVGPIAGDMREGLLRIAREAITNAGRHGKPTRVVVQLSDDDGITLRVTDDGLGFVVDDPRVTAAGRYGLVGMRERATALGGSMRLESRPYGGTRVEVQVP